MGIIEGSHFNNSTSVRKFHPSMPDIKGDRNSLTDFLKKHYLEEYIPGGGSKIKFATGRSGSGKTHLSGQIRRDADALHYMTVSFSAEDVWLHDFREVYLEILRQCDIEHVLACCADQVIKKLGYDPGDIKEGQNLLDYLSEKGEADPFVRGEIRSYLRSEYLRNPKLDYNFACACSLLIGGILGHPLLEEANREILLAFLKGDKTVKLSQLRALGLSPSRVTKYNARNLLRSLAELIRLSGCQGLLVIIDDMEILLNRTAGERKKYTKLRREDSYESIRQLIDDIDNMRYIIFLLCFDRELMDNDNYGMKSYQALWLRIQNEVVSTRFNHFADIIDMDRYADEYYTDEVLLEMAEVMAGKLTAGGNAVRKPDREMIRRLRERAEYGGIGLPGLIGHMLTEEGENNV